VTRYLTGLIGAFLVFGGTGLVGVVPVVWLGGRPDLLFGFLTMWMIVGTASVVGTEDL